MHNILLVDAPDGDASLLASALRVARAAVLRKAGDLFTEHAEELSGVLDLPTPLPFAGERARR